MLKSDAFSEIIPWRFLSRLQRIQCFKKLSQPHDIKNVGEDIGSEKSMRKLNGMCCRVWNIMFSAHCFKYHMIQGGIADGGYDTPPEVDISHIPLVLISMSHDTWEVLVFFA